MIVDDVLVLQAPNEPFSNDVLQRAALTMIIGGVVWVEFKDATEARARALSVMFAEKWVAGRVVGNKLIMHRAAD